MVKEVKFEVSFEYLEPQAVFAFLFGDDQFSKRYHEEQNDDIYANVSDWTADCRRTIKFSAVLSAPKVIQKVVGVDTLEVIELQKYSEIGDTFVITSWPTVEHPQGFSATVEMVLTPAGKGEGCTISTTIMLECKAAVWGVQGTMEAFMEQKAKRIFIGWHRLARLYLMEQVMMVTGIRYTGQEEDDDLSEEDSLDEFFDFSEHDEKALNLTAENRTVRLMYSREGKVDLQNWIMHSVMGQLNGLHITCKASTSHIEELKKRLQKLEDDILVAQQQKGRAFSPECLVWRLAVTCLVSCSLLGAVQMYWRLGRRK